MTDRPLPVFVIASPLPELFPTVHIFQTTLDKIREHHPRAFERFDEVLETISAPGQIHQSKTHPTSVVLLSSTARSRGGDPLRVPIKIVSSTEAIMSSAHFSSTSNQGLVLWTSNKRGKS